ncbi:MAG TPA: hypothetical protein VHS03_11670 [Gaiellaceae bacterium]|nr:hypothetical protein [Gaiellaceae bacterium]
MGVLERAELELDAGGERADRLLVARDLRAVHLPGEGALFGFADGLGLLGKRLRDPVGVAELTPGVE